MLVKVASISINPVDVKARRNDGVLSWLFAEKRPAILGWDISGEITEVGKDVKILNPEIKFSEWLTSLETEKLMLNT